MSKKLVLLLIAVVLSLNSPCLKAQMQSAQVARLKYKISDYNGRMLLQVDAVYENGVLRPLQPLDLKEHEHVLVSVVKGSAPSRSRLAVDYIEKLKRELEDAGAGPSLEEVRHRLSKIRGSMAADMIAERGDC